MVDYEEFLNNQTRLFSEVTFQFYQLSGFVNILRSMHKEPKGVKGVTGDVLILNT